MLLIFGRYRRDVPMPPTAGVCPACRSHTSLWWRRQYKTGHFFFVPLFSFGELHRVQCGACGYADVGRYPTKPPPLPWMDRLGFLVPVLGAGGLLAAFIGLMVFAVATAPPPKPPTALALEKTALESHLKLGESYGKDDLEEVLSTKVFGALQTDTGLAKKELAVAVQVKPMSPGKLRHVIVLVEYTKLSDLRPKARGDLVHDVRVAMAEDIDSADLVTVAVKGTLFYGALITAPEGEPGTIEIDSIVPTDHVEQAFEAKAPAQPAASTATSASAAPSASDAAEPPAAPSASAAPTASGKPAKAAKKH